MKKGKSQNKKGSQNNNHKNGNDKNKKNNLIKDKKDSVYYLDEEPVEEELTETGIDYDPEFENEIQKFEKNFKNAKLVKVFDLLGKPDYIDAKSIKFEQIKPELGKLYALLESKNIFVHFKNEYPITDKYAFIVNEILNQAVEDLNNNGLHISFVYEDFHPDMDIEDEEEN